MSCKKESSDAEWDFAAEAKEHLAMALENALDLYGRPTDIYAPTIVDNDYGKVYDDYYEEGDQPEYLEPTEYENPVLTGKCRVLLGQPVRGLPISDFISLSDKVDAEIQIRTNVILKPETILHVHYPDRQPLKLRVVRGDGFHADSYQIFEYLGVVQ